MAAKKREAIYDPEADRRWAERNKEHRNYLNRRSNARGFIRTLAKKEDLDELAKLIDEKKREYDNN